MRLCVVVLVVTLVGVACARSVSREQLLRRLLSELNNEERMGQMGQGPSGPPPSGRPRPSGRPPRMSTPPPTQEPDSASADSDLISIDMDLSTEEPLLDLATEAPAEETVSLDMDEVNDVDMDIMRRLLQRLAREFEEDDDEHRPKPSGRPRPSGPPASGRPPRMSTPPPTEGADSASVDSDVDSLEELTTEAPLDDDMSVDDDITVDADTRRAALLRRVLEKLERQVDGDDEDSEEGRRRPRPSGSPRPSGAPRFSGRPDGEGKKDCSTTPVPDVDSGDVDSLGLDSVEATTEAPADDDDLDLLKARRSQLLKRILAKLERREDGPPEGSRPPPTGSPRPHPTGEDARPPPTEAADVLSKRKPPHGTGPPPTGSPRPHPTGEDARPPPTEAATADDEELVKRAKQLYARAMAMYARRHSRS